MVLKINILQAFDLKVYQIQLFVKQIFLIDTLFCIRTNREILPQQQQKKKIKT